MKKTGILCLLILCLISVAARAEAFGKKVYYSDGFVLLTDADLEQEEILSGLEQYLY